MSRKTISMDGVTVVVDGNGVEVIGIGGAKIIIPIQRPSSHSAPQKLAPKPVPAKPAVKPSKPAKPKAKKPSPAALKAIGAAVNEASDDVVAQLKASKGKPSPSKAKALNGAVPSAEA